MSWDTWGNWDTAGQVGGQLGRALDTAAEFFQKTSQELAHQTTTSQARAEYLRAVWQQLDTLTLAAIHDLNSLNPNSLNTQVIASVESMKIELAKANVFFQSAIDNSKAAVEIKSLSANMGAIMASAEILYKLNGTDFTAYDFGETGLNGVGGIIGAGVAVAFGIGFWGAAGAGLFAGFAAKLIWEKNIAPAIGWSEEDSPLFWDAFYDAMGLNPLKSINPNVNTLNTSARTVAQSRDPLVLDLDGDGIETVGVNTAAPILFDMNADGSKTATGWIKPDDGLVVLDLNGNGLIDSGAELFGDATVLQHDHLGSQNFYYLHQFAGETGANGFAALADLDLNEDGVINSSDAVYTQLRIWQDANQDAVSHRANCTPPVRKVRAEAARER